MLVGPRLPPFQISLLCNVDKLGQDTARDGSSLAANLPIWTSQGLVPLDWLACCPCTRLAVGPAQPRRESVAHALLRHLSLTNRRSIARVLRRGMLVHSSDDIRPKTLQSMAPSQPLSKHCKSATASTRQPQSCRMLHRP